MSVIWLVAGRCVGFDLRFAFEQAYGKGFMLRKAWRKAETQTRYFSALRKIQHAEAIYARQIDGDERTARRLHREQIATVSRWREAVACQILVPAPSQVAVAWKKSAARDRNLPLSADTIAASIAADEAWLAAYPAAIRRAGKNAKPVVAT